VIYFIENAFLTGKIDINVKWSLPLAFLITILLAIVSYELFEKWFLKMKTRFTRIENRPV
jgi:peptidoglycan/LPS O-acetylase OafA/YrhL